MNLDVLFENRNEYLHVQARGEWNLNDVKEMISLIKEKAEAIGHKRVLLDMHYVERTTNQADRLHCAEHLVQVLGVSIKMAIIGPPKSVTKMTENIAVNRGVVLLITEDENEALKWLLSK